MAVQVDLTFQVKGILPPQLGGAQPFGLSFSDLETPGGVINSTNSTYTLAFAPNPVNSLQLYLVSVVGLPVLQLPRVSYSLSGNILSFFVPPPTGSTLVAYYRYLNVPLVQVIASDQMTMSDYMTLRGWLTPSDSMLFMSDSLSFAFPISPTISDTLTMSDSIQMGFGFADQVDMFGEVILIGYGLAPTDQLTQYDGLNFVG